MNGFGPRPTRRAARGAVPRMAEAALPNGTRPRARPTAGLGEPTEPRGGEGVWQTGTTPTPPMTMPPMAAGAWTPQQMAALQQFMPPIAPGPGVTPPTSARAPRMLERDQLRRLLLRPGGM
jgi:hypothetical protein